MAAVIGSLRAELSATVAKFEQDMGRAANAVRDVARDMTRVGTDFKRTGAQMQSIGTALTKTVTLPLVGLGVAVAKVGIDFESSFAGVRKTVAGVVDNLGELTPVGKRLQQEFRDLAKIIPVSVNELNRLGEAAGALGIPTQAVTEFARVMAELGVTTNLTSDQAAESIAKIQNIFGAAGKDTDRFASTLVALGNAGASTEVEIVEMAKRLAGAGHTIGLTQGQVLGFASALSSVGIEAEAGGTAISKVFIKLAQAVATGGKDLSDFAQIAGVSGETFAAAFRDDAALATTSFVEGLGRIQQSGGNLFGTLQQLELGEVRVRDALLRAAGAGDLFRTSLTLQGQAWRDNTALTIEAQQRYKTTASQLRLLRTQIEDVGITLFTSLKPAIDSALEAMKRVVPVIERMALAFSALPGDVQLGVIGFLAFAAAVGPLIKLLGFMSANIGLVISAFGKGGVATRAFLGIITFAQNVFGAFNSVLIVNGGLIFDWGKKVVVIGGSLSRFAGVLTGLVSTGLGPLGIVLRAVAVAFAALTSPVTLTVAAIVAAGVALVIVTGHWDDLKAATVAAIQVVRDAATVFAFLTKNELQNLGKQLDALDDHVRNFGKQLAALDDQTRRWAATVAGPAIDSLKKWGTWLRDQVPEWMDRLDDKMRELGAATKRMAVEGAKDLHDYAEAIRQVRDQLKDMIANVPKPKAPFFDDRTLPQIMDVDKALALLKAQLAGTKPAADAFKSAIQQALDELEAAKDPAKEAAQAILAFREAVKSLAQELSGKKLLDQAKQYEQALKAIGGASKLTVEQQEDIAEVFRKVSLAYQKLGPAGKVVADHFAKLAVALHPIPKALLDIERADFAAAHGMRGFLDGIENVGQQLNADQGKYIRLRVVLRDIERGSFAAAFGMRGFLDGLEDVGIKVKPTVEDLVDLWKAAGKTAEQIKILRKEFEEAGTARPRFENLRGALDAVNTILSGIKSKWAEVSVVAVRSISTIIDSMEKMKAATTGAALAASVTLVGAYYVAAKAIYNAFKEQPWERVAKDVGTRLGVTVSQSTAQAIVDSSKVIRDAVFDSLNIDGKALPSQLAKIAGAFQAEAIVVNVKAIIDTGGGLSSANIDKFTAKLRDVFVFLGRGSLTAALATKVLDENFQAFADHFLQNGGLISKELQEIIRLNEEWGTKSKAIGDFISGQITGKIIPGLQAFTSAAQTAREKLKALQDQAKTATGDDLKKITEDIKTQQGVIAATAVTSQASVDGLAAAVKVAFFEMQKLGIPILEIVGQLTPVVEGLQAQFEAAGFSGGAAFDDIRATIALASDEIAGPALQAVSGLGGALAGLHNIAQLDQTTFQGLSSQITSTFNNLVAQGFDGKRVLGLMREPLQTIWMLAKDFGFAVDEGTQALLDQAEGAGLVGEHMKPIQQQMLDATKHIQEAVEGLAEVFGVVLPRKAREAAQAIADAMNRIPDADVTVHVGYDDPGHTPDVNPPPEFQHGSGGIRDFGAGTLAVLHGREAVLTEAQLRDIRQWPDAAADSGADQRGDTYYISIPITAFDGESVREMVVKPGGITDMIVDELIYDKRGRGTKAKRVLVTT